MIWFIFSSGRLQIKLIWKKNPTKNKWRYCVPQYSFSFMDSIINFMFMKHNRNKNNQHGWHQTKRLFFFCCQGLLTCASRGTEQPGFVLLMIRIRHGLITSPSSQVYSLKPIQKLVRIDVLQRWLFYSTGGINPLLGNSDFTPEMSQVKKNKKQNQHFFLKCMKPTNMTHHNPNPLKHRCQTQTDRTMTLFIWTQTSCFNLNME